MSELRCRYCGRQAAYYYSDHQIGLAEHNRRRHEDRCSLNPEIVEVTDGE